MTTKQATRKQPGAESAQGSAPTRAVIYARISDDRTSERAGVDRQRADCEAFCKRQGWAVAEVLVDNDLSASRYARKKRTGYLRALDLIETGQANALVSYHLDRLWRQPRELEDLIDRAEQGLTVATLSGDIDLSTGDGRFTARILVGVAAKSSDDTSRRVIRAKSQKAADGTPAGGSRAFGYRADGVTIVAEEADRIRKAAAHVLAGGTLTDVANEWNQAGIRTPRRATLWSVPSIRVVLANPRYAALRVHRGEIVGDASWPAILDRDVHEAITAMLNDPNRRHRNPPRRGLLTGLVKCSKCGSNMRRSGGNRGQALYRCQAQTESSACGRILIAAEPIEAWITEAVFARLSSKAFGRALAKRPTTAAPMREITKLERRADDLATAFARGEITRRVLTTATAEIEKQLGTLREQVAAVAGSAAVADLPTGDPAAWWEGLTVDRRRAVIASVVESIEIGASTSARANDPDVERLVVRWRA